MVKILLADDHELIRRGLRDCLALMDEAPEVVDAASMDGVMAALDGEPEFDLAILDLYMPGMNGLQGLDQIRNRWPKIRVAVISGSIARDDVIGSLDRGAVGFIPKTLDLKAIQNAVRLMLEGERYLPPMLLDWVGEHANAQVPIVPGLTPRENEVWRHLKDGHSNKEIGRIMGLQEVTVKVHVSSLFKKLGVKNRTQATTLFLKSTDAHA